MSDFDLAPLYRSMIGFDRLSHLMDTGKNTSSSGYPPYNVELVDENHYRITIAVAGFTEDELDISTQGHALHIKGIRKPADKERTYLYHGIAERMFERKFQLAEHIHVKSAKLTNGLLHIDLERLVPETQKRRKIEIN